MYGALLTMTPPPPRSQKPNWALAFKHRREEVVGSQEELAARTDVSQSLISQIERGVQNPTGISMDRFARLLDALNWSVAEFVAATGLEVPLPGALEASKPFDPKTLFHPPKRGRPAKQPLWPNLALMIADKQERHPQLREERWQQYLNRTRFSGGQEPDEDGWFEIFQSLRRNNVEPEDWPEE